MLQFAGVGHVEPSDHHAWATFIAADLNQRRLPGYFAESNVQFGIEIDAAAFQEPYLAGNPGAGPQLA